MLYPGSDPALVLLAIRGDVQSRDALLSESLPHVLRWCRCLSGSSVDPEDAAHDALLVILDRLPTLRDPPAFGCWAFGITRNVLRGHRRKTWLRKWLPGIVPDAPDPSPTALERLESSRTVNAVRLILDRLPEEQREVLVLCDGEEQPASAVAHLLSVPVGTVKSRLRLARGRFLREAARLAPALGSNLTEAAHER